MSLDSPFVECEASSLARSLARSLAQCFCTAAYCNIMHADGAGTKSSLAYLYWKETGDLSVWRGIAQVWTLAGRRSWVT